MRFDTKIAIAVRHDLAQWQKLNVTAFLASAIAFGVPETAGKPYEDGSGNRYLEMFRQPVLVYAAERAAADRRAGAGHGAQPADDDLHRGAVQHRQRRRQPGRRAGRRRRRVNLVGVAVHGPRNAVDKVFKGAKLHP